VNPPPKVPETWQATRVEAGAATQILQTESDYLAAGKEDIGRQTGSNELVLFVSCDPALAMQQQFDHLHPDFIAVHDIATSSSRKLMAGIAAASSRAVQKLLIRRQGYGTVLATLEFVELPTPEGKPLRLYSTDADADTMARQGLVHTLLGYSRLGVVMVGDLPSHSIAAALKSLHQAILAGPWPNRELLLLPLSAGSTLATHGAEMAKGTNVAVRTTPQVTRPADAWGFINGTWARLRSGGSVERRNPNSPGAAYRRAPAPPAPAADPHAMRPMPPVPSAASRAAVPKTLLERYLHQLSELAGMVSCCLFDVNSGLEVAHAGASPGAADLAMHGKALLGGISASSRKLGLGHSLPEAAITLGAHHLLLRGVPGHPGLALHAVLDKTGTNLTLARLQVQRMDSLFETPAPATPG
jgi:hypothetical protein